MAWGGGVASPRVWRDQNRQLHAAHGVYADCLKRKRKKKKRRELDELRDTKAGTDEKIQIYSMYKKNADVRSVKMTNCLPKIDGLSTFG